MIFVSRLQREVITGLSLVQAQGINSYREVATPETDRNISAYVYQVIAQMPVVFKLPMVGIICAIGVFAVLKLGRVSTISQVQGQAILLRASWIPGYGIVVKFVRATVYLRMFDEVDL